MNILAISGSHHEGSQSLKVSEYLAKQGGQLGMQIDVVDLATAKLPFWSGPLSQCDEWMSLKPRFEKADGYLVVCPEWGGMVTPQLKNLFLYTTSQDVGHKPAMIVSVSAGVGGAYPVSELRMSGYKNTKICYIPDHIVVRDVNAVLNLQEKDGVAHDQRLRERIDHHLQVLQSYAMAMSSMRKQTKVDFHQYPHGM